MTGEPEPLSPDARQALEKELSELRRERRSLAETLKGPGDPAGDRADEADELQRATQTTHLDARIATVEARLRDAPESGPPSPGVVGVGSTLTVQFADGTTQTVHIGEIADDQDLSLVTSDSPFGRAVLGHRAGDAVAYDTPRGPESAEVLSVGTR
jgi:transcription elongation factor GreA